MKSLFVSQRFAARATIAFLIWGLVGTGLIDGSPLTRRHQETADALSLLQPETTVPSAQENSGPNSPIHLVRHSPQKPPAVDFSLECERQEFPLTIPPASKILVLQVHPHTIEKHTGLREIPAPSDRSLLWPSLAEAVPIPMNLTNLHFQGLKCTLRRDGDPVAIDTIALRLEFFPWGRYELVADPRETDGAFKDFAFYMVNYCSSELPPSAILHAPGSISVEPSSIPVKPPLSVTPDPLAGAFRVHGKFSEPVIFHVLGDPGRRKAFITMPFPNSYTLRFGLPETYRRWVGFQPC